MRLYYSPGSCALAPHIVIEETGAAYEPVRITLAKGEHMTDAFGAINPRRRVPVLELDDGQVLTETHAIMCYLADAHPEARLIPTDPLGRARAHEWMNWLASTVHVTFATFFRPERFLGEGQAKEPMQAAARQRYDTLMREIDGRLPEKGFALGDFSVVDAHLTVFLRWAARMDHDPAAYPAYLALVRRVQDRPAAARALEIQELPPL
ncbi:glutathione S-transferase family protein [Caenispirillum salinarum]|uniref:glutathione S-transferase family protein n=1 Tax=Caenispirillum salinarum TaxID=859058 RepID=UPI00384AF2E6